MHAWAGIALALRGPDDDGMRSRLPTVAHPLAGRSVAWHVLRAMADREPAPARLLLITASPMDPSVVGELAADVVEAPADRWWWAAAERLDRAIDRVLVVDAAAATLLRSLAALVERRADRALAGAGDPALAVWLDRSLAEERAGAGSALESLAAGLETVPVAAGEAVLVRDRASLARAAAVVRDRVVRRLMDGGVTFLLPETVLVDVDVRMGPDTVVYPDVVLEGNTSVGAETVIGPGCRIIDSWVGSGVELKGWNYIVGANIRNRAVLEPYVRRGFD